MMLCSSVFVTLFCVCLTSAMEWKMPKVHGIKSHEQAALPSHEIMCCFEHNQVAEPACMHAACPRAVCIILPQESTPGNIAEVLERLLQVQPQRDQARMCNFGYMHRPACARPPCHVQTTVNIL